jgi:hypothetical protein
MNAEPNRSDVTSSGNLPAKTDERTAPSKTGEQPVSAELAKEEQWALFEKELKESDWGHQPC